MTIDRIETGPRMSQAVVHGDTIYLAGQIAPGQSTAEQTRAVLEKIDALLTGAGSSKGQILTATIWLADIADFSEMNEEWDKWIAGCHAPARATVEAKLAMPEFKVEVAVVAAKA